MTRELLNAYLDRELDDAEQARVERDLEQSPELRRELAELAATRALLRELPPVTPRRRIAVVPGTARRPGPRRLGVAIAAAAAVWLLILSVGVGLGSLPIVPEVDQLAVRHAAAAESGMDFVEMDAGEMDDPAVLVDLGHGMALEAVYQAGALIQARYSDGAHAVSVFHEPGEVDWDELPGTGSLEMMDDGPVWRGWLGDVQVLVTERGDLVVTVVTDGDMAEEMAMTASHMVPEVDMDRSWWDRLLDAPGNLWDRI